MKSGGAPTAARTGTAPWPLLVMATASILLLTTSLVLFARTEWFIHSAVQTTGTLDSISSPDGRTGTSFRFSTTDGQLVRHVSSVTVRSTGMPGPGDRVPVYYDPANPQNAQLGLWAWLWLTPTVLGAIGSTLGLILIGMRWMAGRT